MTHYGILEWADFSRGLAEEEQSRSMRAHLASGCADCRDAATFCEKVGRLTREMAASAVPDYLVQQVLSICPRRPVERRPAIRIPVELVFDSFLAPAPAGLRSTWQVGWQALYRAGDCSLDVRIEPDLNSSRAALIGQVSNHASPELLMVDVPVCLKAGTEKVAETRSNRFGEFQIEYEQQGRMWLCVYLDGGSRCIMAPLRKIASEQERGAMKTIGDKRKPVDGN